MARMATKNTEPALDIVQDTMMVLSLKYANKDEKEWPALFYRILQNKIIDWHRKQTVKNKLFSLFGFIDDHIERHDGSVDSSHFPTSNTMTPDKAIENTDINNSTMLAIEQLPVRQQQAFLLRQWQGLSIRETADAMSISEGSVKTHYSRAISQLKSKLEGIYYEQT